MRHLFRCLCFPAALAGLCGLPGLLGFPGCAVSAQTFAAVVGARPPAMIVADSNGDPHVNVPRHHRNTEEKLIYARVRNGVYTVDGMVAKIRLNYDVQGASYMYLFVPGIGTAVLSIAPDGTAVVTPAILHQDELTFTVDGHHFNVTGVSLASDKGQIPAHLYVRMDHMAWHLGRTPRVGFGNRAELPYEWPGALPPEHPEDSMEIPPVPASVLPSMTAVAPMAQSPAGLHPASLNPALR